MTERKVLIVIDDFQTEEREESYTPRELTGEEKTYLLIVLYGGLGLLALWCAWGIGLLIWFYLFLLP